MWLVLSGGTAQAHDLRPGILAFVEDSPGELRMRFVPPIDTNGEAIELPVVLPAGCRRDGDRVHCTRGFTGELAVGGMRGHAMKIFVSVERADNSRRDWVLTSESPRLQLGPAPSVWSTLRGGVAPFALLLALFLVTGLSRRFASALAVFALASAVAALLALPASGAVIALSILVVAREALRDRATAIRRWPELAAGIFGLVHGGAADLRGSLAALVAIAIVVALVAVARRLVGERRVVGLRAHRAAGYALGALAAWGLLAATVALAS
ncbi:MAG TPA: hypothetical protein VFO79_15705 [Xanthomonadales bacterium]|nr:hypothetical protein [Xanthomonadales bacterium]